MLKSRRLGNERQLQDASRNSPPLKHGATGAGVAALQDVLVDFGYRLPLSYARCGPDGVYGAETAAAVQAFQRDYGLAPDGEAGSLDPGYPR